MKKTIVALVLTSAFIFLFAACGGESTPTPTAAPAPTHAPAPTATTAVLGEPTGPAAGICAQGEKPGFISDVVLAKDTRGANFEPIDVTDTYEPTQATLHAVVTLQDAPQNLRLGSAWYLVQAAGYKQQKIDENTLDIADGGSRNVDFTLKGTQERWPPGMYCVEIYADGKLAVSKNFSVSGESTPSNAGADVVQEIVLAEAAKPDTFEPVNPTTQFSSKAEAIHATVRIENAPPNTLVSAKWYPPNQDPLEFKLPPVDGTRWLDFRLTPAPDGFPMGEYKVEIYVNQNLVDTKIFTVQ